MEGAYADLPRRHSLRRSEHARDHSIILPLYPQLTDEEQLRVIEVLEQAVAGHWLLIFEHDPLVQAGHVRKTPAGTYVLEEVRLWQ